jgi:hypothetical protein
VRCRSCISGCTTPGSACNGIRRQPIASAIPTSAEHQFDATRDDITTPITASTSRSSLYKRCFPSLLLVLFSFAMHLLYRLCFVCNVVIVSYRIVSHAVAMRVLEIYADNDPAALGYPVRNVGTGRGMSGELS